MFSIAKKKPELKIIKLGAEVGATKNLTVYECGDDIIMVDYGIGFPDSDLPGVDVVIPDYTYLIDNQEKIRGLIITHGHEDHFGAVPYLLEEINVPIYCSDLVEGFIRKRIEDRTKGDVSGVSFHRLAANEPDIVLGNFSISAFKVNHSVPGSLGIVIRTPQGTILHMADYKVDWSPVLDDPIDLGRIAELGDEGVLCLLSDCLGVTHEGYSASEKSLAATYDRIIGNAEGKGIFITTISSNISRMHQVIEIAIKHGRKIVFDGRSIKQSAEVAIALGYFPFAEDIYVDIKHTDQYRRDELLFIVAGCYGQPNSALYKLAHNEHKYLSLVDNDLVIFSADPGPPSSYEPVENILHFLTVAGAEVIYSAIQENLHVSGHGMRGDLQLVAATARAKFHIPIGGTAAKMRAYTHMIEELGHDAETVFELLEGETVVFNDGYAERSKPVPVRQIYVDGQSVGEIGNVVIKDREKLSDEGLFVAVVPITEDDSGFQVAGKVQAITRGFVYVKESKALIGRARDIVYKTIDKNTSSVTTWQAMKPLIEKDLAKFLYAETGRRPLVVISEVRI
ncbi:MAG: ribonuclease J [Patescibacteria group bacterium]